MNADTQSSFTPEVRPLLAKWMKSWNNGKRQKLQRHAWSVFTISNARGDGTPIPAPDHHLNNKPVIFTWERHLPASIESISPAVPILPYPSFLFFLSVFSYFLLFSFFPSCSFLSFPFPFILLFFLLAFFHYLILLFPLVFFGSFSLYLIVFLSFLSYNFFFAFIVFLCFNHIFSDSPILIFLSVFRFLCIVLLCRLRICSVKYSRT